VTFDMSSPVSFLSIFVFSRFWWEYALLVFFLFHQLFLLKTLLAPLSPKSPVGKLQCQGFVIRTFWSLLATRGYLALSWSN
jgi:hypothetical protein